LQHICITAQAGLTQHLGAYGWPELWHALHWAQYSKEFLPISVPMPGFKQQTLVQADELGGVQYMWHHLLGLNCACHSQDSPNWWASCIRGSEDLPEKHYCQHNTCALTKRFTEG
jgi:hypothetical protein